MKCTCTYGTHTRGTIVQCTHPKQPHGNAPSIGTCMRGCALYDGPERTPELVASVTGTARRVRGLGIKPCGGCKQRQETLNRMFPSRNRDTP